MNCSITRQASLNRHRWWLLTIIFTAAHTLGFAATNYTVVSWNNLGMHCMDSSFSVFSLLPPYNTIHAQLLLGSGGTAKLITNGAPYTITYQALADPSGSITKTSIGKTDFWQYVHPLFGVALAPDVGLPVPGPSYLMPGTNNVARKMTFETKSAWYAAYGIPITPYDNAGHTNTYPMMRITAKSGTNTLSSTDIVLPVSDEMDCRLCHGSGTSVAAKPAAGWVNDPNAVRDYRLNILRLHDDRQAGDPLYISALKTNGYSTAGLYATVTNSVANGGGPILCAACHLSEALPGTGLPGIEALTRAIHSRHAAVIDPISKLALGSDSNRAACYRCHPGSTTRCLRGAMGNAVAADGSMAMQCQSCHGGMAAVGAATRTGWLNEPTCQSCHTGDAVKNNGLIRYTSVFTNNAMRVAVNQRFATNTNAPAAGLSLYRFSRGHGGLYCEACHGSTHAEFPSSAANDNIASTKRQGHVGMLVECTACHNGSPNTINGGPHGMHPIDQNWVTSHHDAVSAVGVAQCQICHGKDYKGTVLSRAQGNRSFTAGDMGTKKFWRGYQIGCYSCHNGPGSSDPNPDHAPVARNVTAQTTVTVPVNVPLSASDPDNNPFTVRIVAQPAHGTVGLTGTTAKYFPEGSFTGNDTFTYAAWDGQLNSNLATGTVTVARP